MINFKSDQWLGMQKKKIFFQEYFFILKVNYKLFYFAKKKVSLLVAIL